MWISRELDSGKIFVKVYSIFILKPITWISHEFNMFNHDTCMSFRLIFYLILKTWFSFKFLQICFELLCVSNEIFFYKCYFTQSLELLKNQWTKFVFWFQNIGTNPVYKINIYIKELYALYLASNLTKKITMR